MATHHDSLITLAAKLYDVPPDALEVRSAQRTVKLFARTKGDCLAQCAVAEGEDHVVALARVLAAIPATAAVDAADAKVVGIRAALAAREAESVAARELRSGLMDIAAPTAAPAPDEPPPTAAPSPRPRSR